MEVKKVLFDNIRLLCKAKGISVWRLEKEQREIHAQEI
jgi:hypothetical protein